MPVETLIAPTPIAAAFVPQQQRYHSFDSLRAAMMFLGIWMHGVQCYTYLKVYMWPFKDTARSQLFDFTINWVHMFRMPIFFAMAGFFFALLTARRGLVTTLANRAKRILLPFLLGWAVLAPILVATITYLRDRSWPAAMTAATTGAIYWKAGPLHLWFLEYLLLFYPVMLGIDWLVRGIYLLHVPVLIWIQVLIAPLPLPALLKGLLALAIAMPPLLLSYQFLVRHTWVGTLLNGRR